MREWLSGRASPCQGERREFESRLPLHKKTNCSRRLVFCFIYTLPFFIVLRRDSTEPVVVKYSRVKLLFCTIPPFFFAVSGIVLMFRDFLPGLFFFLLFGSCSGYIIFLVCKAKDMLLIAPNGFTLFKRMKNPIFIPWADVEEIFVYKFFPYPFQIGYRLNLLGVNLSRENYVISISPKQ